jgi:dTDP-4-dehydrorhamnose reductase
VFSDVDNLEDALSRPTDAVRRVMQSLPGDLIILGAGGKMGPTLARMARRADEANGVSRRIIAVSRFADDATAAKFSSIGIDVIRRDLMEEKSLDDLPNAANVLCMTGLKFGGSSNPGLMWAMNTDLPARICRRYRDSTLVAFSTGNVYPHVAPASGGSGEDDTLSPVGEYGMSALGRERTFQYFSETLGIPTARVCLNYAVELRYGVLVDIARAVWSGEPVDVSMGYVNVIWQGDANALALCAFAEAAVPATRCNVAGPEILKVRDVANEFGRLFDKPVRIVGSEAAKALLNNGSRMAAKYGPLQYSAGDLFPLIADWIRRGQPLLGKPTHFQATDGVF